MALNRTPFQGITNIVSFNWHFFALSMLLALSFFVSAGLLLQPWTAIFNIAAAVVIAGTTTSLLVSYYVYDHSNLYELDFIGKEKSVAKILNLSAGFDETTSMLKAIFPAADVVACDFYNPMLHTEISIKRARTAFPPAADVISVATNRLPFADNYFDRSIAIFAAHEIRNHSERIAFFNEIARVTKPEGQIIVTEHLRDLPNFLAYTIGFFHFFSEGSWRRVFVSAQLGICSQFKTTPFVTTFILQKNGNPS